MATNSQINSKLSSRGKDTGQRIWTPARWLLPCKREKCYFEIAENSEIRSFPNSRPPEARRFEVAAIILEFAQATHNCTLSRRKSRRLKLLDPDWEFGLDWFFEGRQAADLTAVDIHP